MATAVAVVSADLRLGNKGPQVDGLQSRLVELGYWLGPPSGIFDANTKHAVIAFQKLAGLPRNGVVRRHGSPLGPRGVTPRHARR